MAGTGSLVIVESAAKAKTIQKLLNGTTEIASKGPFIVIACYGHIRDLPRNEMGVDTVTWTPTYKNLDNKGAVLDKLRKAASVARHVYLASDEDTEGEAIAFHLKEVLRLVKPKYSRISFNEITKSALQYAIQHPRDIDMDRVSAQESRRILDRVAGYELSPLLWRRFSTGGLSAGRVQSAALKMLVDRAREAKDHESTPYWNIKGSFQCAACGSTGSGDGSMGITILEGSMGSMGSGSKLSVFDNEKEVLSKLEELKGSQGPEGQWIAKFEKKMAKRGPSAPFTTSTLQQEAYNRHKLPAKRTMQLAQELYEAGHITYMRTDSVVIAKEAQSAIMAFVASEYGEGMAIAREYKARTSNAQEAHEAVRPTRPDVQSPDGITGIALKLYELIWRRAVASQMANAEFADVAFVIRRGTEAIRGGNEAFTGKHSVLVKEGFMKVYNPEQKARPADLDAWAELLKVGKTKVIPAEFTAVGDVTRPMSLYNEPTLVKALESDGIGRPSTYATIVDKLYQKGYVQKGTNPQNTVHVNSYTVQPGRATRAPKKEEATILIGGKETDRMVPTSLGERVADYLNEVTPLLMDAKFTASMESDLDKIAESKMKKETVLNKFYKTFHPAVTKAAIESEAIAKTNRAATKAAKAANNGVMPEKAPLTPKRVIREFKTAKANVVETRYGPAIFDTQTDRFVSLMPFLQWQKKTIEELTSKEMQFITGLPMKFKGTSREVVMGRFGLYVKDGSQNIPMKKELWNKVLDGSITADEIKALPVKKAKFAKGFAKPDGPARPAKEKTANPERRTRPVSPR